MLNYPWVMFALGFGSALILILLVAILKQEKKVFRTFTCPNCGLKKEITESAYFSPVMCSKCGFAMLSDRR